MSPVKKTAPRTNRNSARIKIMWRYILISTLVVIFTSFVVSALFNTTVTHRDEWLKKANAELEKRDTIYPIRGDILAADGSVLATNLQYYTMRIDFRASAFSESKFREELGELCDTLAANHPIRTADGWRAYFENELAKDPAKRSRSFLLLKNLSFAQSEAVKGYPFFKETKNPNKNGLTCEGKPRRCYPYGDMAKLSLGRVGEIKTRPHEIHGISGLEYALDSLLFGKIGYTKKVPLTHNIVDMTDIPSVPGYTLTTTIDVGIQDIVEHTLLHMLDSLQPDWGTVVLMEVKTGDIKAISNFERDSTGNYVESRNHAVRRYEPGSTMKAISMTVALENGFAPNLDSLYEIGKAFNYGAKIKDTHSPPRLPIWRFIEYSSNIGMTKLVAPHYETNLNGLRDDIAKLGMMERFHTGIAGEKPMYMPELKTSNGGRTSLGRQTYGYASQISPLYVCAFYNALANDGRFVRPRLISKITTERGDSVIPVSYVRGQMCSVETARTLRKMLRMVITGTGGTAQNLNDKVVAIAGKTGTSRIAHELSDEDIAKLRINPNDTTVVRRQGYASGLRFAFCGFFPYDNPKYTCMVLMQRPKAPNPAMSSGLTLLMIAKSMYSHGMLGDAPDYRDTERRGESSPTFYATHSTTRDARLSRSTGSASPRKVSTPKTTGAGTVPDVYGLGMREALYVLESAGYEVSYTGDGSVISQSPDAGTRSKKGTRVALTLEQR